MGILKLMPFLHSSISHSCTSSRLLSFQICVSCFFQKVPVLASRAFSSSARQLKNKVPEAQKLFQVTQRQKVWELPKGLREHDIQQIKIWSGLLSFADVELTICSTAMLQQSTKMLGVLFLLKEKEFPLNLLSSVSEKILKSLGF